MMKALPMPPLHRRLNAHAASLLALRARLERIKALADDLGRELTRDHTARELARVPRKTVIVTAMAAIIKHDADAVVRELKKHPRVQTSSHSNARTRH
jgi:uncharacterized protein YbaA (DUF1428 family)